MKDGLTQVKELKDKIHEQYIEIQELNKKIEELELDLQQTNSQLANVSKRCIEAMEYIESYINQFNGVYPTVDMRYLDLHKLLHILKGVDKE